jgi:diguanylate cyclase
MATTGLLRGADRGRLGFQFVFVAFTRMGITLALASVLGGLLVAWGLSYAGGGSRSPMPHLFYIPIVLAAVRFSWPGASVSALCAGLLAGPLLPVDVGTGASQPLAGWLLRMLMFVVIGLFVAWIGRGRSESVRVAFQDAVLSGRLLEALSRGEIRVFYQPILDMETGQVAGVEALARWSDPRHGEISPADFVPVAERTGAVAALDRFVLGTAVDQVLAWSQQFGPLKVSVNVSATRFAQSDLVDNVKDVLVRSGLPPSQLQLEITESAVIDDVAAAAAQIRQLRGVGVRLAIDDFGAGQASLSYLNEFAVDIVKIDRSLTARVVAEPRSARLVSGIIKMFNAVDLEVVGEGIATAEDYVHMQSLGCRFGQGFYIGRPAPADQMTEFLRNADDARSQPPYTQVEDGDVRPGRIAAPYPESPPVAQP